jgi:hypothetical protein
MEGYYYINLTKVNFPHSIAVIHHALKSAWFLADCDDKTPMSASSWWCLPTAEPNTSPPDGQWGMNKLEPWRASHEPIAKPMPTPKEDAEALMNDLLPFAKRMLSDHGEFLPFGGVMETSGKIIWQGATTGEDHSPSKDLIEILRNAHIEAAQAGTIRASAIVYDVLIVPPGREVKQDAISVELDHRDNYSVVVHFPYSIDIDGDLSVEKPFAGAGSDLVFPR